MANDNESEKDTKTVSVRGATINEQQLADVFNIALQNPEICKQLKEVVVHHQAQPVADREIYEKMMMATNLKLMQEMSKMLEPKKDDAKPKATMGEKIVTELKATLLDVSKFTATSALYLFVAFKLLSRTPVVGPLLSGVDTTAQFFFTPPVTPEAAAMCGQAAATACPNTLAWMMNFGYCG